MKTMLRQKDRARHVARCKEKAPLIARIEKEIGWKKLPYPLDKTPRLLKVSAR